ncbi:MAG: glycosyltransferase [bacterium]
MTDIINKINEGIFYYNEGKTELAIKNFLEVLVEEPLNFEANLNLAYIFYIKKKYKNSIEYSVKGFESNPADRQNTIMLITSLIELKKNEDAIKYLEIYFNCSKQNDQVLLDLYERLTKRKYINKSAKINYPGLNILFVQQYAGIRCYKYAKALQKKGHKVTLLYSNSKPSEFYKNLSDDVFEDCIKMNNIKELWQYIDNYDIIHCHNEPDFYTVSALVCDKPVIHDTADLISLRDVENPNTAFFEALANRGASGRIYSTPYQQAEADALYSPITKSLVFYNYISEDDTPKRFLDKLSSFDNNIHIVYQGSISLYKHRNFIDIFTSIADNNTHIHIYPSRLDEELKNFFSQFPNIHYYNPLSPTEIMTEMTKYDIGIIPWNLELGQKRFLDTTIANKLFEYLAAGLPVLTSSVESYEDYFAQNKVGVTFEKINEIPAKISQLIKLKETTDFTKYAITYESKIYLLEEFYFNLIKEYCTNKKNVPERYKKLLSEYELAIVKISNEDLFLTRQTISIDENVKKKINTANAETEKKYVFFVVPYIEDVGGAALTIKELSNNFRQRGYYTAIIANNYSEKDFMGIKSDFNLLFTCDVVNLGILPSEQENTKFYDYFNKMFYDFEITLVIGFPFTTSYYLEYCYAKNKFGLIHYVTYEPNLSGTDLELKKKFVFCAQKRLCFITNADSKGVCKNVGLDYLYANNNTNLIGIPIKDVRLLLNKNKECFNKTVLKVLIISRISATKSYVLNFIEDVCKLIVDKNYDIKVTIIGDGNYLPVIFEIVKTFNVFDNVQILQPHFPLNYDFLLEHDIAVEMGTSALMTTSLGIPTLCAIPTLWFNYFSGFSGYAGTLGFVGVDFDYFEDEYKQQFQKDTFFNIIKEIYNREDRVEYLKNLSVLSKKYIISNLSKFETDQIVDKIFEVVEIDKKTDSHNMD